MRPGGKSPNQQQNQNHEQDCISSHHFGLFLGAACKLLKNLHQRLLGTRLNVFPCVFHVPSEAVDGSASREGAQKKCGDCSECKKLCGWIHFWDFHALFWLGKDQDAVGRD
jgi:hypothetical protein